MHITVRRVPADWEHPTDEDGHPVVLEYDSSFEKDTAMWDAEQLLWGQGFVLNHENGALERRDPEYAHMTWEAYNDCTRPTPDEYAPKWPEEERTRLMAFSDSTSEPMSPAKATPEELATFLMGNLGEGDFEDWLGVAWGVPHPLRRTPGVEYGRLTPHA